MARYSFVVAIFALLLQMPAAIAEDAGPVLPAHCLNTQTASLNMQLRTFDKDPAAAREKFKSEVKDVQAIAKGIGMSQMDVAGSNYTIMQMDEVNGGAYQLSANVNFYAAPADRALELQDALQRKNHPAALSFVVTNGVTGHVSNKCRLITATGKWE